MVRTIFLDPDRQLHGFKPWTIEPGQEITHSWTGVFCVQRLMFTEASKDLVIRRIQFGAQHSYENKPRSNTARPVMRSATSPIAED